MISPVSPPPASTPLTQAAEGDARAGNRRPARTLFCMLAVVGCVTVADLLLKHGATAAPAMASTWLQATGIGALASPFTLIGILFHLLGLAAWLQTLRVVPLAIAYCFTAAQQATIALGAWLWLGEQITPLRWGGILLVLAGVLVLVPSIAAADRAGPKVAGGGVP